MKTIIRTSSGVSLYIFPDDAEISVGEVSIVAPNVIIGDLNSSNASVVENVTAPEDWQAGKYSLIEGEWVSDDSWSNPELEEWREETKVTMRQARLALLAAGHLTNVESAIDGMPEGIREAARIEWDHGSVIERISPLVETLAPALGFTPAQMDDLFKLAETL
jgi:hypothetical protein